MKLEMKKLKMYSVIEKVIPTINTKCLGISKLKRITIDKIFQMFESETMYLFKQLSNLKHTLSLF